MLVFGERGKPKYPERNLSEQSREITNSTHLRRRVKESNPRHSEGRKVLSGLRHPYSPKNIYVTNTVLNKLKDNNFLDLGRITCRNFVSPIFKALYIIWLITLPTLSL